MVIYNTFNYMFIVNYLRLCLVAVKFEEKCNQKKIERKKRRKEKMKENKKS